MRFDKTVIKLEIWDTCGQEICKSLISNFSRNSSLSILVYSIDNKKSFEDIEKWLNEVKEKANPNIKFFLVGNKADLETDREIKKEEGIKFKNYHKLDKFMETSAKTGYNTQNVLIEAAKMLYKDYIKNKKNINEKEEEEEEKEEDEKEEEKEKKEENIKKMKCSSNKHKEIDAIFYCKECNIYICNKCENFHSDLFENHHVYNLDKDIIDIFNGFCKEKNHFMKLGYFCENHNQLCCAACISKIKTQGNGKHTDCKVCSIKKIKNKKKNKLLENINYLEKLSKTIESTINELKKIYQEINENKENLKTKIQNIFTNIRNALNNREDELLLEIDKKYDELYFKEQFIKESEKLPKIIKTLLEKGKIEDKEWEDNNKINSLINICIDVENTINDINILNKSIEKNISMKDLNIKFNPEESEINEFLKQIKNFGNFSSENKYIKKEKEETKVKEDKQNEEKEEEKEEEKMNADDKI